MKGTNTHCIVHNLNSQNIGKIQTHLFYLSTGLGNRKHCVSKKILDMTQDMTSTVFPTKNVAACKQQTKRNNTTNFTHSSQVASSTHMQGNDVG